MRKESFNIESQITLGNYKNLLAAINLGVKSLDSIEDLNRSFNQFINELQLPSDKLEYISSTLTEIDSLDNSLTALHGLVVKEFADWTEFYNDYFIKEPSDKDLANMRETLLTRVNQYGKFVDVENTRYLTNKVLYIQDLLAESKTEETQSIISKATLVLEDINVVLVSVNTTVNIIDIYITLLGQLARIED